MTTRKLIELYGRRFTPFARLAGFVAILIFGLLIAFSTRLSDQSDAPINNIEQGS
jgi:hypothetical protein